MNYNMYSNNPNDFIDPNYIYPRPYIDPMMYINPYMMYGTQYSSYPMDNSTNYSTYTNPYADNPMNPTLDDMDSDSIYPTIDDGYNDIETLASNYPPNMQWNSNSTNMVPPGMPGYTNNQNMMPGNIQGYPNMMYPMYPPGMFPGIMPGMMYPMYLPSMFPGMIPQINMEEFDEEEM